MSTESGGRGCRDSHSAGNAKQEAETRALRVVVDGNAVGGAAFFICARQEEHEHGAWCRRKSCGV
jgi:hypothetical protein